MALAGGPCTLRRPEGPLVEHNQRLERDDLLI